MNNQQYRLNDFIVQVIERNGIEYTINNYLALRDQYYAQKPQITQSSGGKDNA